MVDVSEGCEVGGWLKVSVGLGEAERGEAVSGSFAIRGMSRSETAVDTVFLLQS